VNIKFGADDAFHRDLRARIDRYFRFTKRRPRDNPRMYAKTATILTWLVASYVFLVFLAGNWWLVLLGAVSLALAVAAVGFNIQHDGGHRAYSSHGWVNRWMARSLDLLGGSSFLWDYKHNKLHHTYANIEGHDDDIDVGLLGRLSPHQPRLLFHRLQHFYMWVLYAFLPLKWQLFDDFRDVARGKVGSYKVRRPRGKELVVFVGGKLLFFMLAFGVPMLLHSWWVVLLVYLLVTAIFGLILSVVFQLAHVVEEAQFPEPCPETDRIESHWAVHQVETTVDFAPRNPIVTWFVGGLNYQIEHHLFPRICHIHYPRIARIVKRACERHGIQYNVHPNVWSGIASHFMWLRRMGLPTT
jgi:linoleoyl-CoA desaturase